MTFRLAIAAVLALASAGSFGTASAQIIFPGFPSRAVAVAPPPMEVAGDDEDPIEAAPPIESEPLAAPSGSAATPTYSLPPDTRYPEPPQLTLAAPPGQPMPDGAPAIEPAPPVQLTAPAAVPAQPAMPPMLAARPSDNAPRPPVDVSSGGPAGGVPTASLPAGNLTTGSVPASSAPGGNAADSGLPPEYRPETEKKELPPHLRRQVVEYWTKEPAGTIVIDTPNTYLYLILSEGKAMRYGVGVGREGFTWTGREKITRMTEWPDWFPPSEMIERQPYLPRFMAGGESNPMGARALYLGKTLYRIHGTNQPSTIGTFVSSGCIRLVNSDIEDLYQRVKVGTKVVVLPGNPPVSQAPKPPAPAPQTAANPAPVAAR